MKAFRKEVMEEETAEAETTEAGITTDRVETNHAEAVAGQNRKAFTANRKEDPRKTTGKDLVANRVGIPLLKLHSSAPLSRFDEKARTHSITCIKAIYSITRIKVRVA